MSELPKAGDLIGVRYRIESLLGQGGMGAVFAAKNQATGRAVAIKWMLPDAARSKESVARFLAEARSTAKIEHPNVIQILDVGQDGDAPFLVMERLRGQSLAERLRRGRLSPRETLEAMLPACRGVHEAHTEGIIHRDLKPDNIFLCVGKDGSPRPPKVLDFGISKLFDEDQPGAQGSPMTRTGIAMGTPWYMSPEQLNAQLQADERFDVYAMGVVLYECLAGRPPYDAEGLFELVQQIAAGRPTPIRAVAPDCPPDLEAVTMRAMAADRDARHPTMRELIVDLEGCRARLESGAPAPGYVPPTQGQPAGHPAPGSGPGSHGANSYGANSYGAGSFGAGSFGGGYVTPAPGGSPGTNPMGGGHWTPGGAAYGAPPSGPAVAPTGVMSASGAMSSPGAYPPTGAAPASGGGGRGLLIGGALGLAGLVLVGGLALVGAAFLFASGSGDDSGGLAPVAGGGGGLPGGGGPQGGGAGDNPRAPDIDLTFSGSCAPSFSGRQMVTGAMSTVSITAMTGSELTGSLSLMLDGVQGEQAISTQHRMDTEAVINVMVGQTVYTNMTMDFLAVRNGRIPDPVSGTVVVHEWDPELVRADVTFRNVSLQSTRDGSVCTMNGRVTARGTTYGM